MTDDEVERKSRQVKRVKEWGENKIMTDKYVERMLYMDDLDFKRRQLLKACLEGKKSERNTSQTNEINVLLGN